MTPTREQGEAAAELAQKMARAAGKVSPTVMVLACGMLIETAWMARDLDSYVDFKVAKHNAVRAAAAMGGE
jgi:hypothetical protein